MGIQDSGSFGGFRGKTGPLVGRRVKGKNVITGLHYPSSKPATELQVQQQDRFGMLTKVINSISPLIKVGFASYAKRNTAQNTAYAYNYDRVFAAGSLVGSFDFSKLVYSRGDVATPNCASVLRLPGGDLSFSWLAEGESLYNRVSDRASFLAYHEESGLAMMQRDATSRDQLGYVLVLPLAMQSGKVYCYMSFGTENGKLAGDSVYVGEG